MRLLYLCTIAAWITVVACDRNKEEPVVPSPVINSCNISIEHKVGSAPFAFGSDFTDDFGNMYQFSRAEWYLRIPGFAGQDNVSDAITVDRYFKVHPSTTLYEYGVIPSGTLYNMRWAIGVDSITNHADPNTYEASDPLSNQSPSMHWGWSTGYIFCVLEGLVDKDGNGSYDAGETFSLHVGMDTNYRQGSNLFVNKVIEEGGTTTVNLNVDYEAFIDNIDLSVDYSTHTMDNMPLAVKIANNFTQVVSLP